MGGEEISHCVIEIHVTAFTSFVMGFVVLRVTPIVTANTTWGTHELMCRKPRQSPSHHVVLPQMRKDANSVRKKNLYMC